MPYKVHNSIREILYQTYIHKNGIYHHLYNILTNVRWIHKLFYEFSTRLRYETKGALFQDKK